MDLTDSLALKEPLDNLDSREDQVDRAHGVLQGPQVFQAVQAFLEVSEPQAFLEGQEVQAEAEVLVLLANQEVLEDLEGLDQGDNRDFRVPLEAQADPEAKEEEVTRDLMASQEILDLLAFLGLLETLALVDPMATGAMWDFRDLQDQSVLQDLTAVQALLEIPEVPEGRVWQGVRVE